MMFLQLFFISTLLSMVTSEECEAPHYCACRDQAGNDQCRVQVTGYRHHDCAGYCQDRVCLGTTRTGALCR